MSAIVCEPTYRTATFVDWYRALCAHARANGGSASTEQPWMHRAYGHELTPSEAWDAFTNNEEI